MSNNSIENVPVKITYKDDVIILEGEGIHAFVKIDGSELRKMYWGKAGKGTVTAKIT
jgi:YbbR domain-containing protein